MGSLEDRFWAKVNKIEGRCWEWTAALDTAGYGSFRVGSRLVGAHRISYEIHHGPIPDGLWILHHCDNPCCVNPEHLFLGTRSDNMFDCSRKGRYVNNALCGEDSPDAKLTNRDVLSIRQSYKDGHTQRRLALEYGVSPANISCIIRRFSWKHI